MQKEQPLQKVWRAASEVWARLQPTAAGLRQSVLDTMAERLGVGALQAPALPSFASLSIGTRHAEVRESLPQRYEAGTTQPPARSSRRRGAGIRMVQDAAGEEEERVLISEILIQDKDGQELENTELLSTARKALKTCKPNFALTTSEVQDDVHRIIDTGYFTSCMPFAEDTRDGVRLIFKVGAAFLWSRFKVGALDSPASRATCLPPFSMF